MANNSNSGEMILAFALGAVIGGALGVLLAPQDGKKTREQMNRWARGWLDEGRGLYEDGKEKVMEQAKKLSVAAQAAKRSYETT